MFWLREQAWYYRKKIQVNLNYGFLKYDTNVLGNSKPNQKKKQKLIL